ncbi:MAG: large subunit ribosomal protein L22 [Parcubacteria group bacterium Gr01-1014_20]|nr:MAG: large subunit ribosomal protein L22 [Parcubacteria group bacterium Gr01-1014_20]
MAEQIAKLNYLRIAPRKVRAVANLIKGQSVNEAEAQLLAQRRRPAVQLLKLLRSAVANAKNGKRLDPDKLVVKSIRVDQGPMLKRSLPRARGMATPIQKKMSHITLVLEEKASLKASRFKIVVAKRVKSPKAETVKKSKNRPEKEGATQPKKAEKRGFFQKVFQRKAMSG